MAFSKWDKQHEKDESRKNSWAAKFNFVDWIKGLVWNLLEGYQLQRTKCGDNNQGEDTSLSKSTYNNSDLAKMVNCKTIIYSD